MYRLSPLILLLYLGCQAEAPPTTASSGDPAIDRLTAAIAADPTAAAPYAERATMFFDQQNYDAAIADLEAALRIDSTNVGYLYNLSDVYLEYYRSRLALRTLERAAAIDPDRLETQLRLAETQLILKQYDGALGSLNQATRLDPRHPEAYYLLSQVFAETGDTVRAIRAAEEATQIDPDLTDAYLLLGELLAARGEERAESYFDAAVDINPNDVYAIHMRADYLRDRGRLPEAIAEYRRTSLVDRQYVAGNYNAGLLYLELDSLDRAHREFTIALKNDPTHARAFFFRGYASERLGRPGNARGDYETALRLAPDYAPAEEALARMNASTD